MPSKVVNFPDENDRYVQVQFENAQTPITLINSELTESIVCSFNLNRFQATENENYKHIDLYYFRPQILFNQHIVKKNKIHLYKFAKGTAYF